MSYHEELTLACSVAAEAGALAMRYQTGGVVTEEKADLSPVTVADRETEKLIVERILARYPKDGILGEEGAARESGNGRKWIIDPIDGTRDFVRGIPTWAVLIGFEVEGAVVAGAAHFPSQSTTFSAITGAGAFRDQERIRISTRREPSQSLACVNGFNHVLEFPFAPRLLDWLAPFWAVRSMGGCMDAMLLAAGQAELWIEPYAAAWDLAPLKIILEEAGARFLNFDGGCSIYGGNCVACVPALEPAVRELLSLQAAPAGIV